MDSGGLDPGLETPETRKKFSRVKDPGPESLKTWKKYSRNLDTGPECRRTQKTDCGGPNPGLESE